MLVLRRGLTIFGAVVMWCSVISAILVMLLMLLGVFDVVGRFVFNSPIPAATEFSRILLVSMVFLSFAYAEARGKHIRIEFVEKYLSQRQIHILNVINSLAGACIFAIIFWQAMEHALYSLSIDERIQSTWRLPLYPARFVLAWGSFILAIQFIISLITNIVRTHTKDEV